MTMLRPRSIPNLIAGGLSTSRALYIASRSICYTADGAYDRDPTYDAVLRHNPKARIVIPPRSNAVARTDTAASSQRDDHIASINTGGRSEMAGVYRRRQPCFGRNSNGPIQADHRAPIAGSVIPGLSQQRSLSAALFLTECSPAHARNPLAAKQRPPDKIHHRANCQHRPIPAPRLRRGRPGCNVQALVQERGLALGLHPTYRERQLGS
jgi:hypothetical protein